MQVSYNTTDMLYCFFGKKYVDADMWLEYLTPDLDDVFQFDLL